MSKVCSCGATIEFVNVLGREKPLPLDPGAPVYRVAVGVRHGKLSATRAEREPGMLADAYWVSHFNTCPDAGAYSAAKSDRLEVLVDILEAVDIVLAKQGDLRIGESMPREMNKAMLLLTMARERL